MTGIPSAWLVDEHWGKAYRLKAITTIGRGPDNVVILRDAEISRMHAEVLFEDGEFRVRGVGASGTRLNGLPLERPGSLREGDCIQIAFTTLRFTRRNPSESDALEISRDLPTARESVEVPTSATMRSAVVERPRHFGPRWLLALAILTVLAVLTLALVLAVR